ncbi:MAG: hydantoinase/oxoprolinase family protein [Actinobacteria bacterium]|nr:hydantoinase/oxoprolinase family protein [Actinomycetota bacterium]
MTNDAPRPQLVGVDVGGTFTDVVVRDERDGSLRVGKVPSTPEDQSRGFMEGLAALDIDPGSVALLIHGTTVATNAVIERKGAECLLVTTRGFRDALELGRRDRPQVYGLRGSVHPLVPRRLRVEVDERTRADGTVTREVDEDELLAAVETHVDEVGAVVVSFLHAYANPANEEAACAAIRRRWPELYVIPAGVSLPRISEFERTSTGVVHAYVQPIMNRYLSSLASAVDEAGYLRPPAIVQCNGGIMSLGHAIDRPANTVRSGPAAGVIAGATVARQAGFPNAITADMGGTSFDVALVVDGIPTVTDEKLVDFRIPLRVPTIDVETLGAGGGSLASIDAAGILRVGPESAGAMPGPACYGRGGEQPTVTDANLVLRRINPDRPIGGKRLDLDVSLSIKAIQAHVADTLGVGVEEAAEAILRVVDGRMGGQVRIMSVGRGHDPRDFVLVPFGGAGPLHGAAIMRDVGIPRAVVPPSPGVTSAIGCIDADVRYDFVQSIRQPLADVDFDAVNRIVDEYLTEGRRLIEQGGVPVEAVALGVQAEMHFEGQRHAIRVEVESPLTRDDVERAFREEYRRQYGTVLDNPAMLLDLECHVVGRRPRRVETWPELDEQPWDDAVIERRDVYFDGAWRDTPIIERTALFPGMSGVGPAIVEQDDTTTVVLPDMSVRVDHAGNLILEVAS